MTDMAFPRFRKEIDSFFVVTLLNVVFGALALAFGISYIVTSIIGLTDGQMLPLFRALVGSVALAGCGLGLYWLISSIEIFDGVEEIWSEFRDRAQPVPDEVLILGFVRMIAHYREHKKTIRTMIVVCTLGGFCFLVLGVFSSIEYISVSLASGTITLDGYRLIPSALLALGIAAVSLISSYYFEKFSKTWDLRQDQLSGLEQALADRLGRD